MRAIFRKLDDKRNWDAQPWLSADDAPADAAKCLRGKENKLSVYALEDPNAQMDRVVAALALTRDFVAKVDLAIVPEKALQPCRIKQDRVQANTPDSEVNEWHLDLVQLTVAKIAELASTIRSEGTIRRYLEREVETVIQNSLKTNKIVVEQVNENLIPSLAKRGIVFL